jgi:glycosyltransferase involved in cell wall biosynthesis
MHRDWSSGLKAHDLWASDERRPTILFNALSLAAGGGHAVLMNYLRCFRALRPEWRLILLRGPFDAVLDEEIPGVCRIHCGAEVRGLWRRTIWERRNLPSLCRDLQTDIYFAPNGVYQGGLRVSQCLLVQDPGPYVLPSRSAQDALRGFLLRRAWRHAAQRGDCMGYTSRYMRELVVRGVSPERRHLIAYNGVSERMLAITEQPRGPAEREPFILAVSVFGFYKNYETLIRALAILRHDPRFAHIRLQLMGRNVNSSAYIQRLRTEAGRSGLADSVHFAIDRPWEEIESAYRSAALFSLTSHCESFGIPALEAMAYGLPTVLGDCCAIPEIAGDAALLVPPDDPAAVAAAWRRVLLDENEYRRLQAAGRERCRQFTWTRTVSAWIEVIEALLLERNYSP